jgi:hypothetical protein
MSATAINDMSAKALNHVELVYAPGERDLARALFEILGCGVHDSGGPFLSAKIQPDSTDLTNNAMYASEVTDEQWALEQVLQAELADGPLRDASAGYLAHLQSHPQRSCHFGIRYPSVEALDAALERIEHVSETNPELAGRVSVSGVFRPGDPGSYTDTMVQAFVRTDVIASGLLTFGQHVELQWQVP